MTKTIEQYFDFLQQTGNLIATQDNRITADPLFIVQEEVRVWGVDSDYTDQFAWINPDEDYREADKIEAAGLEALEEHGEDLQGWHKVGYVTRWEFVTACFTEQGCKDFLEINGHNLRNPRIYATSLHRNEEMKQLRKIHLNDVRSSLTGDPMKLEQLNNGNLLFNGVEYAPVEDNRDRLLKRLQSESEGWEVFFGDCQEPDSDYEYELFNENTSKWVARNWVRRLEPLNSKIIYRRRLKRPKELPAQPIDPDQLPVRVTLRNGLHYTAHDVFPEERVHCVSAGYRHKSFAVGVDGMCEGRPELDIIRVGEWLTTEELEAMRNE